MSDGSRPFRIGDEVGQAGQDAHVRLFLDGLQGGREDLQPAAEDDLALLDVGARPTRILVDVTPDVRIAEQRETEGLGHLDGAPCDGPD